MTRKAPQIIEVTSQRIEELLQRAASNAMSDEDMQLLRQIFASYTGFFQIVGDIACRSCAVTFAGNFSRHRFPPTLATTNTTLPLAA